MIIVIPGIPPNVNHYVKHTRSGRHYITGEATQFKRSIAFLAAGKSVDSKTYDVRISVTLGYKQRGDVDNFAKVVLDGLVDAGVIESDAFIFKLTITKSRARKWEKEFQGGSTEIEVGEFKHV